MMIAVRMSTSLFSLLWFIHQYSSIWLVKKVCPHNEIHCKAVGDDCILGLYFEVVLFYCIDRKSVV